MLIHTRGMTYSVSRKCPFCGSDKLDVSYGYAIRMTCTKCWAQGPRASTPEEAVEGWNGGSA